MFHTSPKTVRAALPALLIAAVLAAAGGDEAASSGAEPAVAAAKARVAEYVGVVRGTHHLIAFAVRDGGRVEAYLCDGRGRAERFSGGLEDGAVRLTSTDGDATLSATLRDGALEGAVRLDGRDRRFTSRRATGRSGLYTLDVDPGLAKVTAVSVRGARIVSDMRGTRAIHRFTAPGQPARTFTTRGGGEEPPAVDQLRVIVRERADGRIEARGSTTSKARPIDSGTSTQWCCPYWEF